VTLLEKLAAHRISSVSRAQFYSSGAEAVESAMRLAKAHTQKTEFVSFWGGFHGKTLGVLGQMGSDFKKAYGPYAPGAHLVPFANCYRCPFNTTYPSCGLLCAEYIRKQLKMEMGAGIAGILIEPIQGTAGNVIPPKDFLKTIREIANEFDALLIVDEMITGCGRTGSFWASDYFGVQPDIVCIGKQFGGGFPISAIMSKDSIVSAKPWSIPSGSSSSYGGNPLACAAAAASIGIIDDEGIVENVKRVGEYFLGKLRPMQERYPFIGDVRGLGLMLAIEFVEDKKTKTPMTASKTKHIFNECLKRGLLTMSYTSSFRLQPAMTIDEATIDNVVAILEDVFSSLG
jgi:4-aminobutyrate aminotransferase-like enzyme